MGAALNRYRSLMFRGDIPVTGEQLRQGLISHWEFEQIPTTQTFIFTPDNLPDGFEAVAAGLDGAGGTYPVTIPVNLSGTTSIQRVEFRIRNLFVNPAQDTESSFGEHIAVLLEGPTGLTCIMLADCGRFFEGFTFVLHFRQSSAAVLTDALTSLPSGTFRPFQGAENIGRNAFPANIPAPGPAGPYGTSLDVFTGVNPFGVWKVWFFDDSLPNGFQSARAGYDIGNPRPVAFELHITTGTPVLYLDSVGSHHMAIGAGTPSSVTGKIGNAIRIESGERLETPSTTLLQATHSFTYACWVKFHSLPAPLSDWQVVIGKCSADLLEGEYILRARNDSEPPVWRLFADAVESLGAPTTIVVDTWYFVAFGRDNNIGRGFIFLNGSIYYGPGIGPSDINVLPYKLVFGMDPLDLHPADISLDEVSLWHRAVPLNELIYLYNAGAGRRFPWETTGMLNPGLDVLPSRTERLTDADGNPIVGP